VGQGTGPLDPRGNYIAFHGRTGISRVLSYLYLAVGRPINWTEPLKSYREFPEALHVAVSRDAYNQSI